jgi:chromosome segregation ATPase
MQGEVNQLTQQVSALLGSQEEFSSRVLELQNEVGGVRVKQQDAEKNAASLQKLLEDRDALLKKQAQELSDATSQTRALEQLQQEQQAINKELQSHKSLLEDQFTRKSQELEGVQSVLQASQGELAVTKSALASATSELASTQDQLAK